MTTVLLDAGALVAVERGDRAVIANLEAARRAGDLPATNAAILGQVWRGGDRRQANLARFLHSVRMHPIDDELGRAAGVLLGSTGTSDVVDAALVAMADDGDRIITTDPGDIQHLLAHGGRRVTVVSC